MIYDLIMLGPRFVFCLIYGGAALIFLLMTFTGRLRTLYEADDARARRITTVIVALFLVGIAANWLPGMYGVYVVAVLVHRFWNGPPGEITSNHHLFSAILASGCAWTFAYRAIEFGGGQFAEHFLIWMSSGFAALAYYEAGAFRKAAATE